MLKLRIPNKGNTPTCVLVFAYTSPQTTLVGVLVVLFAHVLCIPTRARSAFRERLPSGKHARSSALWLSRRRPLDKRNESALPAFRARSKGRSAPAQRCKHVCQRLSAQAEARLLTAAQVPAMFYSKHKATSKLALFSGRGFPNRVSISLRRNARFLGESALS